MMLLFRWQDHPMSVIIDQLCAISVAASKLGIDLASNMNPAATPGEIKSETKELPFELPSEVLDLYRWKNGVQLRGQGCEPHLLPGFYFMPLQRSVEITRILIGTVGPEYSDWRKSWYSLCEDLAGDHYGLEVSRGEESFGRIYYVQGVRDPFPAFWSFEMMLRSILECYKQDAYFINEDGCLEEDVEKCHQICRQFNQGLSPYKFWVLGE